MKGNWMLMMALSAGLGAAGAELHDFDFSQSLPGRIVDRCGGAPGVAPAPSAWGVARGTEPVAAEAVRPGAALGSDGRWNALRLGDQPEGVRRLGVKLAADRPFTLALRVWLYDRGPDLSGTLLNYGTGYREGFRLEYTRAHWNRIGQLNLVWGTPQGSSNLGFKTFGVGVWHQVVVTYTGSELALYVDGKPAGQAAATLNFPENRRFEREPERDPGRLQLGGRWWSKGSVLDFKIDELKVSDQAWSAEAVAAAWAQLSAPPAGAEPESQLTLATDGYGYVELGKPVAVRAEVPGAETLRVNDRDYPLPLTAPVTLTLTKPGLQVVKLAARRGDRVLREVELPVAAVPELPTASRLGVADLPGTQPEAAALGIRRSRVVVDWARLEPQKQEYDWSRLDAALARHRELGLEPVVAVTGRPGWVKLREGSENLPADPEPYRKLWRLLASRYEVKFFEVGQEMNRNGLRGSAAAKAADYAELVRIAAAAIREENPEARVIAGTITGSDLNFARALLKAAPDFDILSIQTDYADPVAAFARRDFPAELRKLTDKPIWNTACGFRQPERLGVLPRPGDGELARYEEARKRDGALNTWPWPTLPESTAADRLIQDLALQLSGGVECCILEYGPSRYYPEFNYTDGAPGAMGIALAAFNARVTPETRLTRLAAGPELCAVRYENPAGRPSGVILFGTGAEREVTLEPGAKRVRVTATPSFHDGVSEVRP